MTKGVMVGGSSVFEPLPLEEVESMGLQKEITRICVSSLSNVIFKKFH